MQFFCLVNKPFERPNNAKASNLTCTIILQIFWYFFNMNNMGKYRKLLTGQITNFVRKFRGTGWTLFRHLHLLLLNSLSTRYLYVYVPVLYTCPCVRLFQLNSIKLAKTDIIETVSAHSAHNGVRTLWNWKHRVENTTRRAAIIIIESGQNSSCSSTKTLALCRGKRGAAPTAKWHVVTSV